MSRRPLVRPGRVRKFGGNITIVVAMDERHGTILFCRKEGGKWMFPWKFTQWQIDNDNIAGEIIHNQTGVQTQRTITKEFSFREKREGHTHLTFRIIVTPIKNGALKTEKDCETKYMLQEEVENEDITPLCKKVIQYLKVVAGRRKTE